MSIIPILQKLTYMWILMSYSSIHFLLSEVNVKILEILYAIYYRAPAVILSYRLWNLLWISSWPCPELFLSAFRHDQFQLHNFSSSNTILDQTQDRVKNLEGLPRVGTVPCPGQIRLPDHWVAHMYLWALWSTPRPNPGRIPRLWSSWSWQSSIVSIADPRFVGQLWLPPKH